MSNVAGKVFRKTHESDGSDGFLRHDISASRRDRRSILLIEDDVGLCKLMAEFFSAHDFHLETAHNGMAGLSKALEGGYDLILLDIMLPILDGLELLKSLRQNRNLTPVILLTARTGHRDRIEGLDAGADDYIPKPFAPHELLARVRAVLRRTGTASAATFAKIEIGQLRLDPRRREVWKGKLRVEITSIEFDILEILMRSAGHVVSRERLASDLCRKEFTASQRFIDVHISHLRRKLEEGDQTLIRSIRGVGYLFLPAGEEQ
jgi:two-component system, OmpR family, response regulator CpxR